MRIQHDRRFVADAGLQFAFDEADPMSSPQQQLHVPEPLQAQTEPEPEPEPLELGVSRPGSPNRFGGAE